MTRDDVLELASTVIEEHGLPMEPAELVDGADEYLYATTGESASWDEVAGVVRMLAQAQSRKSLLAHAPIRELGTWRLLGRMQPAACLMSRRAGEAPGSFKRSFPKLWPSVARFVGGRPIDPSLLDRAPGRPFDVYEQRWLGGESLTEEPSFVLLLRPLDVEVPADLQRMMRASSTESGHPTLPDGVTAGWVRLARWGDVLLVEEVQSDWISAARQWASLHPSARRRHPDAGPAFERLGRQLDGYLPYLLAAAFKWACDEGIRVVQMPGWSTRAAVSALPPPRSVYEQLPRRFGMRHRDGASMPVLPLLASSPFWSISI